MTTPERSQNRSKPSTSNSRATEGQSSDPRQELLYQLKAVRDQYAVLQKDIDQLCVNEALLKRIDQWEKDSIKTIKFTAEKARYDSKQITDASKTRLNILIKKLNASLMKSQKDNNLTENNIEQWKKQLEDLRKDLHSSSDLQVTENGMSSIRLIAVPTHDDKRDEANRAASSTPSPPPATIVKANEPKNSPPDGRSLSRTGKADEPNNIRPGDRNFARTGEANEPKNSPPGDRNSARTGKANESRNSPPDDRNSARTGKTNEPKNSPPDDRNSARTGKANESRNSPPGDRNSSQDGRNLARNVKPPVEEQTVISKEPYFSLELGLKASNDKNLTELFQYLAALDPMDKNGPMSGKCEAETSQMEQFLINTFGFKNIPHQHIVQGVKSFQLQIYPDAMNRDAIIHFPDATTDGFVMTIKEIIKWQRSYKVYAYQIHQHVTKDFLLKALQGLSADGYEAFIMKYVVRISTCPILMEFDAKIIPRRLDEDWPHHIKLVSVTGIDFAGRKHDVDDILFYVSNWRDIYDIDRNADKPALANERDFRRKRHGKPGKLYEERLLRSLKDMARLRLQACDEERVQIVVETGIGLGVFAGEHIGIAEQVQITSAMAIRAVLEEHGSKYKNIQAIVFALPVFDRDHGRRTNTPLDVFAEQFNTPEYKGSIPVLIADQDMHRLTIAIARRGYIVSQLNPADSHGVFGEYWQNRGPAVEEKLALTTLGLLVQHHLINRNVLDTKNYEIIPYPDQR